MGRLKAPAAPGGQGIAAGLFDHKGSLSGSGDPSKARGDG